LPAQLTAQLKKAGAYDPGHLWPAAGPAIGGNIQPINLQQLTRPAICRVFYCPRPEGHKSAQALQSIALLA
jgi:hypothetical protein